jgi:hypothetical protein
LKKISRAIEMPENWMDYKVGQKVYISMRILVHLCKGDFRVVKVDEKYAYIELDKVVHDFKIGKKWGIEIGTNIVSVETGAELGFAYQSEDAYISHLRIIDIRKQLNRVDWLGERASNDQVETIAKMLNINSDASYLG